MTEKEEKIKKKKVIRIVIPKETIVLTNDKYTTMEIEPCNEEETKKAIKEFMECEIE